MIPVSKQRHEVVIIGAGISGLIAALELDRAGVDYVLLEASDAPGGRVRTDEQEGFLLDRGFQVYLRAYPEGQRYLDYEPLVLRDFIAGAIIKTDDGFTRVADPRRHRTVALNTAVSTVGTLGDKLRVARMMLGIRRRSLKEIFVRPEISTLARLRAEGFSDQMIRRFFRPFLGGIFLDPTLTTSSRMMEFVLKMMAAGPVSLPDRGIEEIPRQLARRLRAGTLQTHAEVVERNLGHIRTRTGATYHADQVIIATEPPAAHRLHPRIAAPLPMRKTTCLYFAAEHPPMADRWLMLNGLGKGLVNNLCVPSETAPGYAPKGASLISVTVLDDRGLSGEALVNAVKKELEEWFGGPARRWRALRTYSIPKALPAQGLGFRENRPSVVVDRQTLLAGDYLEYGSLNGAMRSGRRAAHACLKRLGKRR